MEAPAQTASQFSKLSKCNHHSGGQTVSDCVRRPESSSKFALQQTHARAGTDLQTGKRLKHNVIFKFKFCSRVPRGLLPLIGHTGLEAAFYAYEHSAVQTPFVIATATPVRGSWPGRERRTWLSLTLFCSRLFAYLNELLHSSPDQIVQHDHDDVGAQLHQDELGQEQVEDDVFRIIPQPAGVQEWFSILLEGELMLEELGQVVHDGEDDGDREERALGRERPQRVADGIVALHRHGEGEQSRAHAAHVGKTIAAIEKERDKTCTHAACATTVLQY